MSECGKKFLMPGHEMLYATFYTNFEAFHNRNEIKVSLVLTSGVYEIIHCK